MTDEQRRRIDDHRPAVGLQWDENNPPPRTPIERPEQWTILLTSGNHGLVGAYGHTFPHAESDHERINVVDEAVVIKLRERIREIEAAGSANKAVLTDEQIKDIVSKLFADETVSDEDLLVARAIEATVRDKTLEDAAQIAVRERDEYRWQAAQNDGRESDMAFGSINSAERIEEAIRALKGAAAQSVEGGDRG